MCFGSISGTVPTPSGDIFVSLNGKTCEVTSPIDGGTLILGDKKYPIPKCEKLTVEI